MFLWTKNDLKTWYFIMSMPTIDSIRLDIQTVLDVGTKNNEQSQKFIDSSHDLLEDFEAICESQMCDEMVFIKVADSLGSMVNAFKKTQEAYSEVYTKLLDNLSRCCIEEENKSKKVVVRPIRFTAFHSLIATMITLFNRLKILMNLHKKRCHKLEQ